MTKGYLGAVVAFSLGLVIWVGAAEITEPVREPSPLPARQMRPRERLMPRTRVSRSDPNAPLRRPQVQESMQPGTDPFLLLEARHQELTAELTAILKIAQEENAVKTAEALQKLIDKRQEEYKQNLERMQQRRAEMQRRIEQRLRERTRVSDTRPSAPTKKVEQPEGVSKPQPTEN